MREAKGPVALITGAGGGLGREAVLSFARSGYRVIATGRDIRQLRELKQAMNNESLPLATMTLDMTSRDSFERKLGSTVSSAGSLDVLVLCAGIHRGGALEVLPERALREVMEANFFGPLALARAALPLMREQGGGRILVISSLSGLAAPACDGAYSASKHALEGAFEALSQEVDRWRIYIALVHFGAIASSLLNSGPAEYPEGCYTPLAKFLRQRSGDRQPAPPCAATIARQLPAIAEALPGPLRWACDEAAGKVFEVLGTDRQAQREQLLRGVTDIDWWRMGLMLPPRP